jgi:hypothetical protein
MKKDDQGDCTMRNNKFVWAAMIALLLATVLAWAREDKLENTGVAPAAQGKVTTGTDQNGNTSVEIKVEHLAKPTSLKPSKEAYLVWIQPSGQAAQLLGALRVGDDLKGELKGSTPSKNFDVLITAEDQLKADTPSSTVVLKGNVARQ